MNTYLQVVASPTISLDRDWKLFADRLAAALAALFSEADGDAEPLVAKHVDFALCRFCGATDGVDAMLQRDFGGRTAFLEPPSGALLH